MTNEQDSIEREAVKKKMLDMIMLGLIRDMEKNKINNYFKRKDGIITNVIIPSYVG